MKWLPTAVAIGVGLVTLADFFYRHPLLDTIGTAFREWTILLTAFALLLGLFNLLHVHFLRVARRNEPNPGYSLVLLATALAVTGIGFWFGLPSEPMTWIFSNLYLPLQGAFFALVAFFLASAAYRALRANSFATFLMLAAALIVLIGQIPLTSIATQAKDWILSVPSEAGVRGLLLGVALGTLATGVRLLVGIDRPYSE
ncbi:MAG: hypothetical protein HY257_07405 [Chloroflexi bacterium]|nr:hypothetical protein [Chloroflexota bacterium]